MGQIKPPYSHKEKSKLSKENNNVRLVTDKTKNGQTESDNRAQLLLNNCIQRILKKDKENYKLEINNEWFKIFVKGGINPINFREFANVVYLYDIDSIDNAVVLSGKFQEVY